MNGETMTLGNDNHHLLERENFGLKKKMAVIVDHVPSGEMRRKRKWTERGLRDASS